MLKKLSLIIIARSSKSTNLAERKKIQKKSPAGAGLFYSLMVLPFSFLK